MRKSTPQDNPQEERPSRTAVKNAALAVTDLAHQIAELPEATFRRLPLDAEARAAFVLARGIKASSARARQLRHLSALLRNAPEMLQAVHDTMHGTDQRHYEENRLFHQLETLRDRLLQPESAAAALDEAVAEFPVLDREALARAVHLHHKTADKKHFRTVFRLLREAAEKGRAPQADE